MSAPAAASAPSEESSSSGTPYYVVTGTNNNSRSDVRIQKTVLKAQEKQKLSLGLHPSAKQRILGRVAGVHRCRSRRRPAHPLALRSSQPIGNDTDLYHAARSPYKTTNAMLIPDTWSNAASYLRAWRQHGTFFYTQQPAATTHRLPWARGRNTLTDAAVFQHVQEMVYHYDNQLVSAITQYRWAMALLGRLYATKIARGPTQGL
jgi:hypothetical protein